MERWLKKYFGYSDFRPGQKEIVQALLANKNLLSVMPTGAGKSICYQLPAMLSDYKTIIVSPLVSLMDDQVASLKSQNIPAEKVHSNCTFEENGAAWRSFSQGEAKILYVSPERLMTDRMVASLNGLGIGMFVIDEAHCISKWGAGFRPDYNDLSRLQYLFPGAVIAAFTATADEATRNDIVEKLTSGNAAIFLRGFDRPNLSLAVLQKSNWKQRLLEFLHSKRRESGIIYCLSRKNTETVAAYLSENGFNALPYHAGQDATVRRNSQGRFMTEEGLIMVATIAFGMGIDKPDIRFVVHANLPSSMEAFYQEIGRAGRDGASAETIIFYGLDDLIKRRRMINQGEGDDQYKLREQKRLDTLVAYCEAATCRRKALLVYFDDVYVECGNCDNCLNPPTLIDGTELAQMALSVISTTGEYFGTVHIVNVVRGTLTEKVLQRRHNELSNFGVGKERPKEFWQALIRQLLAAGHISVDIQRYGALRISDTGRKILSGDTVFNYKNINSESLLPSGKSQKSLPKIIGVNEELLAKLKVKRLDIAREKRVPAFVIFSDRSLTEMAAKRPQSESQFLDINGVGPQKLKEYGKTFLSLIMSE
ncbi:MAG TPA: DNA helicase RecQ [Rhodospirillales bacterium]|nr:DNA helicase RecQ [Rhodospirillales bacterium]